MTQPTTAEPSAEQPAEPRATQPQAVTAERTQTAKRPRPPIKTSCDCCS